MHGNVIQYFLLHVYHSQSISRDVTGRFHLGTDIISYYFSMFVYLTLTAKGKETVRHGQPSLESSQEVVKMPVDEPDNNNDKEIKHPESESKVVTTIINSSFHTYIRLVSTIV